MYADKKCIITDNTTDKPGHFIYVNCELYFSTPKVTHTGSDENGDLIQCRNYWLIIIEDEPIARGSEDSGMINSCSGVLKCPTLTNTT